jgi:hypothetical protein
VLALAGLAEGRAWAAAGPDGITAPTGDAKGKLPSTDSGKEMDSLKPGKVIWREIGD